jgi:hypothetical protein
VTEKVLHGATVPMLVARRKGEGEEESARHAGIDALRTP